MHTWWNGDWLTQIILLARTNRSLLAKSSRWPSLKLSRALGILVLSWRLLLFFAAETIFRLSIFFLRESELWPPTNESMFRVVSRTFQSEETSGMSGSSASSWADEGRESNCWILLLRSSHPWRLLSRWYVNLGILFSSIRGLPLKNLKNCKKWRDRKIST